MVIFNERKSYAAAPLSQPLNTELRVSIIALYNARARKTRAELRLNQKAEGEQSSQKPTGTREP